MHRSTMSGISGFTWTSEDEHLCFALDMGIGALYHRSKVRYSWDNHVENTLSGNTAATQAEFRSGAVSGLLPMGRLGVGLQFTPKNVKLRGTVQIAFRVRVDLYYALLQQRVDLRDGGSAGHFRPMSLIVSVGPVIRF